ncbi:MAG: UDP-3-O-acyl-N-acetylglucosamine deacetylase [Armatimonadetes bacterium]|nr:UDP-3-O-acyl-N-acetylglucosamine deacetylase [Armatimonadota bacterium]
MNRMTIKNEVEFSGIGIHTGELVKVRLVPEMEPVKEAPTGVIFVREGVAIPAHITFVSSSRRCVVLSNGGVSVGTVEHLLAALWAFGITDVRIYVEGPEIPIGEGNAMHWVKLLSEAGVRELPYERSLIRIKEPIEVGDEQKGIYAMAEPCDRLCVHYTFKHERPFIGTQSFFGYDLRGLFVNEIAPARTFGFIEEVEELRRAGLGKGGSLDNCLIVFADGYSAPLKFENELVRHKVLDLLGDTVLLGRELIARIEVCMGGHDLHLQLMKRIWKRVIRDEG